jgi:TM2 domain-containing membrane protein YozV
VNKIIFVVLFMCSQQVILVAQNSFSEQYDYAKKLYEQEKYFDAVTEFKRLLFFAKDNSYDYDANFLIGLSYKNGAKFSEAIQHFIKAEFSSTSTEGLFKSRIEIVKINILRRTTSRALAILDSLQKDSRFKNDSDQINYWKGWAYIFADDWKKASSTFKEIQAGYFLSEFCDSVANELYNPNLAKILSIVPGAGQFYTGEYVSGLISIGWNVLWGYLTIEAFVQDRVLDGVLIGSLLWWRFYSGNIQNAEKFALEKNLQITNSALHFLQLNYSGNKP